MRENPPIDCPFFVLRLSVTLKGNCDFADLRYGEKRVSVWAH